MTAPNNNLSINNRLIDQAAISQTESGGTRISQQAEIGGKEVTITLNFNKALTTDEAQKVMEVCLEKVARLAIAFKLGQKNNQGETTRSLTLHKDKSVTRSYTKESAESEKIHTITYEADNVSTKNKIQTVAKENIASQALPESDDEGDDEKKVPELARPESIVSQNESTPISDSKSPVENQSEMVSLPPPSFSRPSLKTNGESSSSSVGKLFTDEFKIKTKDGTTQILAKEQAVRADTVATLKKALETNITKLTSKIEELKNNPTELEKAMIALTKAKIDLKKFEENSTGATHASTNMPRFAFKRLGMEAKEKMAPVLPNLRMQTVENSNGEVISAVTRSAAISDFSHGEVSLQELKDLKNLENFDKLSKEEQTKLKELYLRDTESSSSESPKIEEVAQEIKIKALIGYGAEKLVANSSKELSSLISEIQNSGDPPLVAYSKLTMEQKELLDNAKIEPEKLTEVQSQRREKLKLLVLQDLALHFKTTPLKGGKEILYGRTALVDLQKKTRNQHGFIMNERTQGLDMKAIFEELDGAEVKFDKGLKDPYIDEKGGIHMPQEYLSKDPAVATETKTLNSVFFNICVQSGNKSHMKNDGMQKNINDKMLEKLRTEHGGKQEFQDLETSLKKLTQSEKNDPNQTVLLVTQFLQKNGGYSGINCYGGKDRTGYATALITHSHLKAEAKGKADPKSIDSQAKNWGQQLLSSKGIAGQIANDNADHTALKLTRTDLELYGSSIKGHNLLRTAHRCKLGVNIIRNKITGTNSASLTAGQLYKEEAPTIKKPSKITQLSQRISASMKDRITSARKGEQTFKEEA